MRFWRGKAFHLVLLLSSLLVSSCTEIDDFKKAAEQGDADAPSARCKTEERHAARITAAIISTCSIDATLLDHPRSGHGCGQFNAGQFAKVSTFSRHIQGRVSKGARLFCRLAAASRRFKNRRSIDSEKSPHNVKRATKSPYSLRIRALKDGGAGRNRTDDRGFAVLGLTTWRPRHLKNGSGEKDAGSAQDQVYSAQKMNLSIWFVCERDSSILKQPNFTP